MKRLASLALGFACLLSTLSAQNASPGLRAILTDAEWRRAGLDRLTPDQIGVIDAALIRHSQGSTQALKTELETAKREIAAVNEVKRERSLPPLRAKVVEWQTANRFKLDNGQIWEGLEPIPYELAGQDVEITARPAGRFQLTVAGRSTGLRVTCQTAHDLRTVKAYRRTRGPKHPQHGLRRRIIRRGGLRVSPGAFHRAIRRAVHRPIRWTW